MIGAIWAMVLPFLGIIISLSMSTPRFDWALGFWGLALAIWIINRPKKRKVIELSRRLTSDGDRMMNNDVIDPDLIAARNMMKDFFTFTQRTHLLKKVDKGEYDQSNDVQVFIAGIKHGRESANIEGKSEIERLREANEKALHILQYCPDKQEKAVALLSAALQNKEYQND